jgi:hypothetical protein
MLTIFLAITTIVFFSLFLYALLKPDSTETNWLFVQSSSTATVSQGSQPNTYTLTMENVSPETHQFSDRPIRKALIIPTAFFVDQFSKLFGSNFPNVAIASEFGVDIVKMSAPVLNGSTLTYTFELIDEIIPSHHHIIGTYNNVKLFIDDVKDVLCWDQCADNECKGKASGNGTWQQWYDCMVDCNNSKKNCVR